MFWYFAHYICKMQLFQAFHKPCISNHFLKKVTVRFKQFLYNGGKFWHPFQYQQSTSTAHTALLVAHEKYFCFSKSCLAYKHTANVKQSCHDLRKQFRVLMSSLLSKFSLNILTRLLIDSRKLQFLYTRFCHLETFNKMVSFLSVTKCDQPSAISIVFTNI